MANPASERFNLLDLSKANIRTLHLGWFAFFISFMVWFAHAPLMPFIREALQLTDLQAKVLLTLNVALTIPARIVVGMLVDRYGPRIMFSSILILGGIVTIVFSLAQGYEQLMNIPMYAALAMLAYKLSPAGMKLLSDSTTSTIYAVLLATYLFQVWKIWQLNSHVLKEPVPELQRYSFTQVAILDLAYMVTFGTELAVVSMLPMFYVDMFGLDKVTAGLLAGSYAVINLVARPAGGLISDTFGRKITLIIVFLGIGASFMLLGQVSKEWSVLMVIAAATFGGIFSKAGSGAVYAMVPLIHGRSAAGWHSAND